MTFAMKATANCAQGTISKSSNSTVRPPKRPTFMIHRIRSGRPTLRCTGNGRLFTESAQKIAAGETGLRGCGPFSKTGWLFPVRPWNSRWRIDMCTLTFVPTEDGYVAGMNRDEKLIRPHALPPERFDFPGVTVVFPREHSGGTWMGCNS